MKLKSIADALIISMDEYFYTAEREVILLSIDKQYINLIDNPQIKLKNDMSLKLSEIQNSASHFEMLFIADTAGNVIASNMESAVDNINISDREYCREAKNGDTCISEAVISKASGNPVVVIAAPVFKQSKVVGIFGAVIDISVFNRTFIDSVKIGNNGYAYIVDSKSNVNCISGQE